MFLKLSVADSGRGSPQTNFRRNAKKASGLNNIEQRLSSYYGETAHLKIESEIGKGTTRKLKFRFECQIPDLRIVDNTAFICSQI